MHDLLISAGGDLVPNWTGGLTEADAEAVDYADLAFRIKTNDPEMRHHALGANLEDLYGKPNEPAIAQRGEASILRCLTFDGRFASTALSLSSAPLDSQTLRFFVGLRSSNQTLGTQPYFVSVVQLGT